MCFAFHAKVGENVIDCYCAGPYFGLQGLRKGISGGGLFRAGTEMAVALPSARIEFDGDEKEEREGKQRRPAIAEERQGNAYHGRKSENHADVYENMKQEYAQHRIAVNASVLECLAFGEIYKP